ncbi:MULTISPECIES: PaaI family thioesterase [Mycobacterium]|uniref:PaaI family thioesterase n=1 Tax=Mycobacterium kiyosense TaxID=2871094 RepID=A0A9P3QB15_9MYCO|nr:MULTISPECIES: hypothetical protein [Mycobacterium]BDB43763.1 hypothetical protein IWGMT90018_42090 [Mycobacterium kiyosense]BDE15328.1 hypothetical protein MKCMC460_41880 [Mycobacterium sp. 20KCMC460]GLB83978.1 hypothetical protein SRL2020028_32340 [Mycobacterium kiyosense]GLB91496.1 hypothetical protein SRL2020130_43130 [Mycobacterium kiyosense]GLB97361.1 hypothetical protein SRL2020226_41370 [Mycobacterium kiyosense]
MAEGTSSRRPSDDPSEASVRFGETPLDQTVAAAAAMRRLASLMLSLESPHPAVDAMVAKFAEWEAELAAAAPADSAPRIGERENDARRVYLNHATDIGAYNPCFPEYRFERLDPDAASGRVTFPVLYEGPPGLVHGGFLGVFFDCVIQHHNCHTGRSGKTRSLNITFRRPTPLLTELGFDIARSQVERGITSTARLLLDGEVLCTGEVSTLASRPDQLSTTRFGRRRTETQA